MIKRAKKQGNFTTVYNEFIVDTRLSARAKGVMIWLLSKPDDWVVNKKHLYSQFKEGRDAIWKAFLELVELGYIIPVEEVARKESGRFNKRSTGYLVYEVSIYSSQFNLLYPETKEPQNQFSVPRSLLNTDDNKKLNKNKETNTENITKTELKDSNRFFDYLDSVGLEVAAQQTYKGISEGQIVSVGILPPQLKDKLIEMGCAVTPNKKLYIPNRENNSNIL